MSTERVFYFSAKAKEMHCDIAVVGGGLAGTMAAVAAARAGHSVILVEKYGCLGGMATSGLVNPFCPYRERGEGTGALANAGLFTEMLDALYEAGGCDTARPKHFSEETLKVILDRMTSKAGVRVLFHTLLTEVDKDGGRIRGVTVSCISGNIKIFADMFIDATGNADLTAFAGLGFHMGRESDGLFQPMTLFFRMCGVDYSLYTSEEKAKTLEKYKALFAEGELKNEFGKIMAFRIPTLPGVMHFNSTRVTGKNPLDVEDMSQAETDAREQCFELYNFLKENARGMENTGYIQTAVETGVRESRRIIAEYELTADDILGTRKFDDSIARGTYCIDIHNPKGGDIYVKHIPDRDYYTIPYRSLIPTGTENLIVAGRPIGATHEAHAAIRIMPITTCIGEGAGTAAALAVSSGCNASGVDIGNLREKLAENGALI